jgi:hypothetical protein
MMKRRDFLKYTAGAVGGISVAVAADVMGLGPTARAATTTPEAPAAGHDHAAALGGTVEVIDDFQVGTRRVQIVERNGSTRMRLDGRELSHHHFAEVDGFFKSHMLPFREDRTARGLAKALIADDGLLYRL